MTKIIVNLPFCQQIILSTLLLKRMYTVYAKTGLVGDDGSRNLPDQRRWACVWPAGQAQAHSAFRSAPGHHLHTTGSTGERFHTLPPPSIKLHVTYRLGLKSYILKKTNFSKKWQCTFIFVFLAIFWHLPCNKFFISYYLWLKISFILTYHYSIYSLWLLQQVLIIHIQNCL